MKHLGIEIAIKNIPELDKGFIPMGRFNRGFLKTAKKPVSIAVERSCGQIARVDTYIHGTADMAEADAYYADGYYLSRIESDGYGKYMLDILSSLEGMDVGDIKCIESEYGYHIVMKYELDEGKFGDGEYAEWFEGFNTALQNKLFLDKCKSIFEKIDLNDENLEKARSITEIGTNYNY